MVRPERFELPTFWFVARRSIQLSYERTVGFPPNFGEKRREGILTREPRAAKRPARILGQIDCIESCRGIRCADLKGSSQTPFSHVNDSILTQFGSRRKQQAAGSGAEDFPVAFDVFISYASKDKLVC